MRAAEVLAHLGSQARTTVPALRAALKDEDSLVQRWAAFALGEIGPEAREALAELIELRHLSPDVKTRAAAWAALRKIDPQGGARSVLVCQDKSTGEVCRFYGHRAWVQCVAFSGDGRWAVPPADSRPA